MLFRSAPQMASVYIRDISGFFDKKYFLKIFGAIFGAIADSIKPELEWVWRLAWGLAG